MPLDPVLLRGRGVHSGTLEPYRGVMWRLRVEHSTNPAVALEACSPYLESEPAERNVLLTLLHDRVTTGTGGRYWWVVDSDSDSCGGVAGVAVQTPLDMFVGISRMEAATLDALVPSVVSTALEVPGVVGEAGTAAAFAGRYASVCKVGAVPLDGQRLYRLGTLVPPDGVPGSLRRARADEAAWAERWGEGFDRDTGEGHDGAAIARVLVASGRLYFWDVDGERVAMASRQPSVAGTARISFVYTPPPHRGRGYAAACTAALC